MQYEKMRDERTPEKEHPPTVPGGVPAQQGALDHPSQHAQQQPAAVPPAGTTMVAVPAGQQIQGVHMFTLLPPPLTMSDGKARLLWIMGAVQIALGCLAFFLNVLVNIFWAAIITFVAPGYWCGILFIIAGAFGVVGGQKKRKGFLVTFLVMSVISSVFTMAIIGSTAAGIPLSYDCHHYYYPSCLSEESSYVLNSLMLVCGLTELVISIVSAALCCNVLCKSPGPMIAYPSVQYTNGTQQLQVNGQAVTSTNWFPANATTAGYGHYPAPVSPQTAVPAAVYPGIAGQPGAGYYATAAAPQQMPGQPPAYNGK